MIIFFSTNWLTYAWNTFPERGWSILTGWKDKSIYTCYSTLDSLGQETVSTCGVPLPSGYVRAVDGTTCLKQPSGYDMNMQTFSCDSTGQPTSW